MTKTEIKHTPTPWQAMLSSGPTAWMIVKPGDKMIARVEDYLGTEAAKANAALIVEAVNNYEQVKAQRDALLSAIIQVMADCHAAGERNWLTARAGDQARAAIAQVEGEKGGM